MKKKRFIKLLRAEGYPPYIIQEAVDAIKSCGGRMSYSALIQSLSLGLGFTLKQAVNLIKIVYGKPRIKPLSNKKRPDGLRANIIIDEWSKPKNESEE